MKTNDLFRTRRRFLNGFAAGTAAVIGAGGLFTPGVFAQKLIQTPRQTEGPFYPNRMPLDTDNDLLIINDSITPALGTITYLSGRVLDSRGMPIRNALVEIWQCDNNGVYLHTGSGNAEKRDVNFQGFGRFLTGSTGEYTFRTIKPVPYPGRTPHIHFEVKIKGQEKFVTQCYIKGHPANERDSVLKEIRDAKARESVLVDFTPIKQSSIGEVAARFDIVLGSTAAS
jgi:protocatechuate 3,4-dioxygenase beta subunit